jgi:hypothetical protein
MVVLRNMVCGDLTDSSVTSGDGMAAADPALPCFRQSGAVARIREAQRDARPAARRPWCMPDSPFRLLVLLASARGHGGDLDRVSRMRKPCLDRSTRKGLAAWRRHRLHASAYETRPSHSPIPCSCTARPTPSAFSCPLVSPMPWAGNPFHDPARGLCLFRARRAWQQARASVWHGGQ